MKKTVEEIHRLAQAGERLVMTTAYDYETSRLAGEAGVKLTSAGATFPYGRDPDDRNIRLAPTMPSVDEIKSAMEVFCTCVELASVLKLGEKR